LSPDPDVPDAAPAERMEISAPPSAPRPRVRPLAILGALTVIAASLVAAYLLVAYVLFDLFGERWVNRRPDRVQISWKSARIVDFGEVELEGFEIRGRTRRMLWWASVDQGRTKIALADLLARELRFESMSGQGVRFHMRRRPGADQQPLDLQGRDDVPDSAEAQAAVADIEGSLPTIGGFEGLPMKPPKLGKPSWTVTIDNMEFDQVREIWLEGYRYQTDAGNGKASGRMEFRLRQSVEIEAFAADLPKGRLNLGPERMARVDALKLRGALDPTITRRRPKIDLFTNVDADIDVWSSHADFGVFQQYLRGSQIDLEGAGKVEAHLIVDQGVLADGSRIDLRDGELTLRYFGYQGTGRGHAVMRVAKIADGTVQGTLDAVLEEFAIRLGGAGEPHLRGRNLRFAAIAPQVDVVDRPPMVQATVDLPWTAIPDLSVYNRYFPDKLPLVLVEGGDARISSLLKVDTGKGSAEMALHLEAGGFRARMHDTDLVGDLKLEALLATADLKSKVWDLRGTHLRIDHLNAPWNPPSKEWWGRLEFLDGTLKFQQPLVVDGHVQARLRDSAPIFAILLKQKPMLGWLEGAFNVEGLTLTSGIEAGGGRFVLRDFHLEGDQKLVVDAQLRFADRQANGLFHVDLGLLGAGIEIGPHDREWKIRQSRAWYERKAADFWTPEEKR
jgi:hypothetical protein